MEISNALFLFFIPMFNAEIKLGSLYTWLLITYFLFSPIYFKLSYPIEISGDGGLIYFLPLSVSFVTLFVSLPVLFVTKYMAFKKILLGYVLLFFLIFSNLLGTYISLNGGNTTILQTILISNTIGLFITFGCIWLFSKER